MSDDIDFCDAANRRRSVREFKPVPVEAEELRRILEAGMKAPSHNHRREWGFVLLKDVERRKEVLQLEPSSHDFAETETRIPLVPTLALDFQEAYSDISSRLKHVT